MTQQEPDILIEKVKEALRKMKCNKAPGIDKIPVDTLKMFETEDLELIHLLCNKIWRTCEWPKEWGTSITIPLHKKGS